MVKVGYQLIFRTAGSLGYAAGVVLHAVHSEQASYRASTTVHKQKPGLHLLAHVLFTLIMNCEGTPSVHF
jgi:hypothetical protein